MRRVNSCHVESLLHCVRTTLPSSYITIIILIIIKTPVYKTHHHSGAFSFWILSETPLFLWQIQFLVCEVIRIGKGQFKGHVLESSDLCKMVYFKPMLDECFLCFLLAEKGRFNLLKLEYALYKFKRKTTRNNLLFTNREREMYYTTVTKSSFHYCLITTLPSKTESTTSHDFGKVHNMLIRSSLTPPPILILRFNAYVCSYVKCLANILSFFT